MAKALDLAAQLEGVRLVVVGGTGFLGKVWLSLLLHRYPQIGKVYLVVRSKAGVDSEARFWAEIASARPFDPLRERLGAGFDAFMQGKIVPIDADVSKELCGFSNKLIAELSGTVDAVVNVAGVVDFNPPLDEALLANAFGVQKLVDLARALGDVPVLHTSTAYVAGYRKGLIDEQSPLAHPFPRFGKLEAVHWSPAREIDECLDLVAQAKHRADDAFRMSEFRDQARRNLEDRGEPSRGDVLEAEVAKVKRKFIEARLIEAGQERATHWGWTNIYTYTKSIGEQILAASGLRYTLVRPTVIESSLSYPFRSWNEGINTMGPLVYLLVKGHMQVPAGEHSALDVIPVDMVAGGMIVALAELLEGVEKPVYHLGSSDTNALPMPRLVELVGLYKRRHYQKTARGNALLNYLASKIEPVAVSRKGYEQHGAGAVAKAVKGASGLLGMAAVGPLSALVKPAKKALDSYASLAQRNGDIWDLYVPFTAGTEYTFECRAIRGAMSRLGDDDRKAVLYEPETLDWRFYIHEVQCPGLERWVFGQIDEKIARPLKAQKAHENLLSMLEDVAERHDLAVAFQRLESDGLSRITFRDVKRRAELVAARLVALGIEQGDRVLIGGQNHPDWPISYLGILRAGAVAVPFDPGLEAPQLANVIRASGAKLAIFDEVLEVGHGGEAARVCSGLRWMTFAQATADEPHLVAPPMPRVDRSTVASIIYTSGTTGTPKGVMLTHGNFTSLVASLAPIFPLGTGDRALSVLPLHHTFEFTCGFLLPFTRGARVVYLDELTGERVVTAMKKGRITAMVGVPALWQLLERRIMGEVRDLGPVAEGAFEMALSLNRKMSDTVGFDLSRVLFGSVHERLGGHIKYLISGGAALPTETAEVFAGLGLPLSEGYGLTEAAPVLTVAKAGAGSPMGSVGKAVPDVEIKIDAPDANGVGEVLAKGPNVMAGYAGDAEATARAIDAEGWLHTGDLGKIDRKGRLTIVGRSKDVIVGASGENVYPDDVERLLGEVPLIEELCLCGVADPRGGERLACLAMPKPMPSDPERFPSPDDEREHEEAALKALREALSSLPSSQQPRVVKLTRDKLPRTATRKVKRNEVRAIVEKMIADEAARTPEVDAAGSVLVRAAVAQASKRELKDVHAYTRLRDDLGLDSLMSLELAGALESALPGRGVSQVLARVSTVGELEQALGLGGDAVHHDAQKARHDDDAIEVPAPLRDAARGALAGLQRTFYGDMMRPSVTGRAFIPQNRNTIVVANHASHLDMGLVKHALGAYGDDLVALAARDYFFERHPLQRAFFENFTNLAPIDRHAGLKETLREVGKIVDQGKTVLIFPEGTRSPDGQLREFKGAVGHLALRHHVDILPVWLGGTYDAMPRDALVPMRRDLKARIGPPLRADDLARLTHGMKPAAAARRVAQLAQQAIEALRDGKVLDLSKVDAGVVEGPKKHPLVVLFDELPGRFVPGKVPQPVSFYFTLGQDESSKWTVLVTADRCTVLPGKPEGGTADCVLKTTPEMFSRIVREGYTPGVPEFMSGVIKSNDVSLLETFQKVFALG